MTRLKNQRKHHLIKNTNTTNNTFMSLLLSIILTLTLITPTISKEVSKTYQLYHSFYPSLDSFAPRGSITLSATATSNGIEASVTNLDDSINHEMMNDIVVDDGAFYRVKVVEEGSGRSATASVPLCEVRRANFREEIELTIGHTGSIISLSYTPLVSPLALPCASLPPLTSTPKFQTRIAYSTSTAGMAIPAILPKTNPPPGLRWIPRSGDKGGAGGGPGVGQDGVPFGAEKDKKLENQSFLRRYWYIILPLVLSSLFSQEEPPRGGSGGGGSSGGGGETAAVGAAAGAAVAGAAGGGAVRQRRGKRG